MRFLSLELEGFLSLVPPHTLSSLHTWLATCTCLLFPQYYFLLSFQERPLFSYRWISHSISLPGSTFTELLTQFVFSIRKSVCFPGARGLKSSTGHMVSRAHAGRQEPQVFTLFCVLLFYQMLAGETQGVWTNVGSATVFTPSQKDLELARGPGPPEHRPGFWVSHILMKAEQCSLKSLPLCKRLIRQQVWVPPGIPVLVYFVSMTRNCWVCVQTLMVL